MACIPMLCCRHRRSISVLTHHAWATLHTPAPLDIETPGCSAVQRPDSVAMHLMHTAATGEAAATSGSGPRPSASRGAEGLKFQMPNSPFAASGRRGPATPRQVLYKGPFMLPFRFLVRAKVFQLLGVFTGALLLMAAFSTPGIPNTLDVAAAAAVVVGCIVTSYCVWFYSSRYVGELSLLMPDRRVARFSVLDFWGNRQDMDIPVEHIDPPFKSRSVAEVKALTSSLLMPITVNGDRQYYISVRHGQILQKDVLQKICYGVWLEELDKQASQTADQTAPGAQATGQTQASGKDSSASTPVLGGHRL